MTTYSPGFQSDLVVATNIDFSLPSGGGTGSIAGAGQLFIGTGNVYPLAEIAGGSIVSPGGTLTIGYSAPNITIDVASGGLPVDEITVQASTAPGTNPVVPTGAGNITINGNDVAAAGIPVRSRSSAANSLTIEVQRASQQAASSNLNAGLASFDQTQFAVDGNGFVTLLGGGTAIDSIAVQAVTAPGVSPVTPTGAGLVTFNGAAVAAQTIPVQSRSIALNSYQLEVQRASSSAATNATQQGIASFNSANFSVDANGWVSAIAGPGSIDITPTAGINVTNSTFSLLASISTPATGNPFRTFGVGGNSIIVETQVSSAQAISSLLNAGLCSFDSSQFTVDPVGWVSNLNGLPISSVDVDGATAPGTDPVLPTALGVIGVGGAQVAAGTVPSAIRTQSIAANSYQIQVQRSSAQAVSSVTQNGVCHFNSAQFTVDANGFVSSLAGTAPWLDSAGGALANHTGYFATAAAVYTLPAGAANGDMVEIVDTVGGGVVVTASGADIIQIQNVASSAGGTATSTQKGDSLRLSFRLADLTWYQVPGAGGNWLLA